MHFPLVPTAHCGRIRRLDYDIIIIIMLLIHHRVTYTPVYGEWVTELLFEPKMYYGRKQSSRRSYVRAYAITVYNIVFMVPLHRRLFFFFGRVTGNYYLLSTTTTTIASSTRESDECRLWFILSIHTAITFKTDEPLDDCS